ncbi:hypothetical protein [Clostridium sp. JS66]|uniref:hypothetical protein n=1 Tax=Clostridium sp. JS66 TaxID=3064705 RepID=UPI00298EAFEA|nr:hypothetical protein [Clostridium sp. JS66]WPC42824.1 hypothetical protein Q6H37_04965 [Clostridium sp. JS66]
MSRADTLRQKIERNIGYIFKESELLAKKYPDDMVFSYIESWCHRIVLRHDPIFTIDFDDEIDMLEDLVKINYSNKGLKSYYSCVIKTNEMIKEKYKNKIPNPIQSFRQSLKEMKLMRDGEMPKPDIKVFLDKLDKEIKEEK